MFVVLREHYNQLENNLVLVGKSGLTNRLAQGYWFPDRPKKRQQQKYGFIVCLIVWLQTHEQ